MALHPGGGVHGQNVGRGSVGHAHRHVAGLGQQHMLVVLAAADAAAAGYLLTAGVGEGWGSHGDTLELAQEVAGVGRLVVTAHLPHHGLAVLGVVPQRVVAPGGRVGGGIDAYVAAGGAQHQFLAPVAQQVALVAGSGLGVVVGLGAVHGLQHTLAEFEDTGGGVARIDTVHGLLEQVAVPVDAEVEVETAVHALDVVGGDTADGGVVAR